MSVQVCCRQRIQLHEKVVRTRHGRSLCAVSSAFVFCCRVCLAWILSVWLPLGEHIFAQRWTQRPKAASRYDRSQQGVLNTCLTYISQDVGVTEAKGGAVMTSILLVGAASGGFFAGQIADAIGPRRTLQYNNIPLLLGSFLGFVAPNSAFGFWSLLLGTSCCLPRVELLLNRCFVSVTFACNAKA